MRIGWVTGAVLAATLVGQGASAEEPAGDWGGRLLGRINIVFHIKPLPGGGYEATSESPDQGDAVLPVDRITATPERLSMALSSIGASYEGAWDPERRAWVGHLTQGGKFPLVLTRLDAAALAAMKPKRPQDQAAEALLAKLPNEEVRIQNPTAPEVILAGVFSKPNGPGPFPAALLIAGSGPQTRDENVAGHKIFAVLAAELNRRGVAVLRYDKRGSGASTGRFGASTTSDFATDAEAAFRYLAGRPDVRRDQVGLIGHSEGGAIAPIVATKSGRAAFVVLLAAPGQVGADMLLQQQELIAAANGAPAERIAAQSAANRKIFDTIRAASNVEDARAKLKQLTPAAASSAPGVDPVKLYTTPWMFEFLRQDPAPPLRQLRAPVLVLAGSLDLQVSAKENLKAIRHALAGRGDVDIKELPGLNHLFQTASTGSPNEYGTIQETIAPVALQTIGEWVEKRARLGTSE